jgi:hypothetical protein
MTDSAGNQVVPTIKYLPFGEARNTPQQISGYSTDKRLPRRVRLYTASALTPPAFATIMPRIAIRRYYDPTIGRFISPDTTIQSPANPQCFNRYSYALNNPLKYLDPSGHVVEICGFNVQVLEYMSLVATIDTGCLKMYQSITSSLEYQAYDELREIIGAWSTFWGTMDNLQGDQGKRNWGNAAKDLGISIVSIFCPPVAFGVFINDAINLQDTFDAQRILLGGYDWK